MSNGLRLIGGGLGRTGTQSIAAALRALGVRSYGMRQIIGSRRDLEAWGAVLEGGPTPDWSDLLADRGATIGWPMCFFVEELARAYPDAKVLLTLRDPERWFESLQVAWSSLTKLRALRFVPRVAALLRVVEPVMERVGGAPPTRDAATTAFRAHVAHVREVVPPDRLIEYRVTDGWGPLCQALGVAEPAASFPRINSGSDVLREAGLLLLGQRGGAHSRR